MATIEQLINALPAIRQWLTEPTADEHAEYVIAIESIKMLLSLAERLWAVNQGLQMGLQMALNKQPDVPLSLFTVKELDILEVLMARINNERIVDDSHEFQNAQILDGLKLALAVAGRSLIEPGKAKPEEGQGQP